MAFNIALLHEDGHVERTTGVTTIEERYRVRDQRRKEFPVGTRVKLVGLAQTPNGYDDSPNLPPGSTGVVSGEPDDFGSLPIKWDHGSSLSATADDRIVVHSPDTEGG
jgi:hypothetical protein